MDEQICEYLDQKTKPVGSLGILEKLALQICRIQHTLKPLLNNPQVALFAADHGITGAGVSAYPREVTWQMVLNILQGGAAISVFSRQNNLSLSVIDAGVDYDFETHPRLWDRKIARGTRNMLEEPAMNRAEIEKAFECGQEVIEHYYKSGSNTVIFGEMGIGNTSSASLLMHHLTGVGLQYCVGSGTGLDQDGINKKLQVLEQVTQQHSHVTGDPIEILKTFGGFEIAMMCSAMLHAASKGMIIVIDGFISTSACLMAHKFQSDVIDYMIFAHESAEPGHRAMLNYLQVKPVLNLNMRLGEGSGAAISWPILQSSVNMINEMADFESAGVSKK